MIASSAVGFNLSEPSAFALDEVDIPAEEGPCHWRIIARANNLLVGRAAYETAVRLYPRDRIDYRDGARIIARSDQPKAS